MLPFAENSREAFAHSFNQGFTSECDVWASSDGVPVILHDETLDRTAYSTGKVVEYDHPVSERERVAGHMTSHETRPAGYERPGPINYRISHTYGVSTLSRLS